jgi:hypothetical protein
MNTQTSNMDIERVGQQSPLRPATTDEEKIASSRRCLEHTVIAGNTSKNGSANLKLTKYVGHTPSKIHAENVKSDPETEYMIHSADISPLSLSPIEQKLHLLTQKIKMSNNLREAGDETPKGTSMDTSTKTAASKSTDTFLQAEPSKVPFLLGQQYYDKEDNSNFKAPRDIHNARTGSSTSSSTSQNTPKPPANPVVPKRPLFSKLDFNEDGMEDIHLEPPHPGWNKGMVGTASDSLKYDVVEEQDAKGAVGIVAKQGGRIKRKGYFGGWWFL